MERTRLLISYNGQWEEHSSTGDRYVGGRTKGVFVSTPLSFEGLLQTVNSIVRHDSQRYNVELQAISVGQGMTCRTDIVDDNDVQFLLMEDKGIPQVCVTLVERRCAARNENNQSMHSQEQFCQSRNTQHFGSISGGNQVPMSSAGIRPSHEQARNNRNAVNVSNFENFDGGTQEQANGSRNEEHVHEKVYEPYIPSYEDIPAVDDSSNDGGQCSRAVDGDGNEDDVEDDQSQKAPKEWVIPGAELYSFVSVKSTVPTTTIYKGQFFPSKKDLSRAIGLYSIRENFEYKVKRSNKSVLHLVCKVENCTWKLRAVRVKDGTYFTIRSFVKEHTCPMEVIHQQHRQATSAVIGEVVAPRLQQVDGRIMRPKDIITDMKEMFGIQVLYSKAHAALKYAKTLTYGDHEKSYQLLPSFAYMLEQQNPGTVTQLHTDELDRFLYFFMAFGASLSGFRRCMRPVIAVDGTHLKGTYNSIMFIAVAQDGNEQIYPIAFGYGDSQNQDAWIYFMQFLRNAIGSVENLVIISDRHTSIDVAMERVFPDIVHGYCCWHLGENLKKEFHRTDVNEIFYNASRVYTLQEYEQEMDVLRCIHERAYHTLITADPRKWSRVHCPRRRYNIMTTNIAESMNSCLRFAKQFDGMTLAEFIRSMLQRWFFDRHQKGQACKSELTNTAHELITERIKESQGMSASHVDENIYLVRYKGQQWMVNLLQRTCTCKVFDLDQLPCKHALVVAREHNIDLTSLCADYYKKTTLVDAYSIPIMPVGNPSEWVVPDHIRDRVCLPPLARTKTGRPRRSHTRSAAEPNRTQRCTSCGDHGHNSRKCSNPHRASGSSGRGTRASIPEEYRRRCRSCHQIGHNRLTCPQKNSNLGNDS